MEVKHLLEALVVYEWVVNSPHEESNSGVDNFCQSIFQKLHHMGVKDPIIHGEDGIYSTTEDFFNRIHDEYIESYNEDVFWADLSFEFGSRDLSKKYSESEFQKLSEDEKERKTSAEIERYDEEFEKYGIERLFIKK